MIYLHGFVPDDFRLLKIRLEMFHWLTITGLSQCSPVISKMLAVSVEGALESSHLQFGIKNNSSCSHAIFLLKGVTDCFVSHGSNVYMASLDARKVFDRVNHMNLIFCDYE